MLHIQSHSVSLFIFSLFNPMKTGFKIHFKKNHCNHCDFPNEHLDFLNIKPILACFSIDQASGSRKNYMNVPLLCQMFKYSELSLNIQI